MSAYHFSKIIELNPSLLGLLKTQLYNAKHIMQNFKQNLKSKFQFVLLLFTYIKQMKDVISMSHPNAQGIRVYAIDKVNVVIFRLVCQHVVVNRNILWSNYAKSKLFYIHIIVLVGSMLCIYNVMHIFSN